MELERCVWWIERYVGCVRGTGDELEEESLIMIRLHCIHMQTSQK